MSTEMNPHDERDKHGDRDVEAALRALSPALGSFDRDRLMFLAGQAAVGRPWRNWFWPLAAATASLAAGVMAVMLALQPAETERIVYRPVPVQTPLPVADEPRAAPVDNSPPSGRGALAALASFLTVEPSVEEDHYLATRNRVLRLGVHMLAENSASGGVAGEKLLAPSVGAARLRQFLPTLEP